MDCLYRGCMFKNADRTNKIIAAGEKCQVPTRECFWKDPCDVKHTVKTRSQARNEPTIDYKAFYDCQFRKGFIDRWVLGKEQKNN